MCALHLWLLSAQWGHPQTCPPPLLPHSAAACWTPTPDSLPAGSLTTPHPTVFLAFLFPCFFGGDKRLPALERSTPASVSSRLPGPLIPPGMFPASKQREVHLAGPADGAHAARAQVPPPSPGARVGALGGGGGVVARMVGVAHPPPRVPGGSARGGRRHLLGGVPGA